MFTHDTQGVLAHTHVYKVCWHIHTYTRCAGTYTCIQGVLAHTHVVQTLHAQHILYIPMHTTYVHVRVFHYAQVLLDSSNTHMTQCTHTHTHTHTHTRNIEPTGIYKLSRLIFET